MDLQAQASQAAQQGQQLLAEDRAKSSDASTQYTNYSNQANEANKNLQSEATYMQGEGSGENVYGRQLAKQEADVGFNPAQLSDANKTLFSLTGAMNSANQSFNTPGGVGAYGMSAPALASYEGSILNPLQTGVSNANTQVGALNTELGTLETGASQATTAQVQGEQNTVTALTNAFQGYQAQAAAALQNMQFYSQLAQQQGGMNAQMQKDYANSVQLYAAAEQAKAQAGYLLSQTRGQDIANQAALAQLNAPKPAAAAPAPPKPNNASASNPVPAQIAGDVGERFAGSAIGNILMPGIGGVIGGLLPRGVYQGAEKAISPVLGDIGNFFGKYF